MVRGFASLVIAGSRKLAETGLGPVTLLIDDFDAESVLFKRNDGRSECLVIRQRSEAVR